MGEARTVGEGAATETVDALALVCADDDVRETGAVLEEEDSVGVTAFRLATTFDTTAVASVSSLPIVSTDQEMRDGKCVRRRSRQRRWSWARRG